jgi:hypothetical protein
MKDISFVDLYRQQTTDLTQSDSLDNRIDFMESVFSYKGKPIQMHDIHLNMQRCVWEWEQEKLSGIIMVPFGTGKTVQVTQGLVTYKATLSKRSRFMTVSSGDNNSKKNGRAIRNIIRSEDYASWCKKNKIEPIQFSDNDNDSVSQMFFEGNETGDPSVGCWWLLAKDAIGSRCEQLILDDFVSPKSQRYPTQRQIEYETITQVFMSRPVDPDMPVISVCTPWHEQDANFRLLETGDWAWLRIRVADDKRRYLMEEYRPHKGELLLHKKDYNMPLWSFKHSYEYFIKEERKDPVAYKRNFEMDEKARDLSAIAYRNYSDLMEDYNENGENIGGNVTKRGYDPQGETPVLTCDFNIKLQGWVLMQRHGNQRIVVKELVGHNKLTPTHANDVAKQLSGMGIRKIIVRGDATSWWSMLRSGSSEYQIMEKAFRKMGIHMRKEIPRSNPNVTQRVNTVNEWLCDVETGYRRLLVNEQCKLTRKDFRDVSLTGSGEIVKSDVLSHISDAIGYYIQQEEKGSNYLRKL